MNIKHLIAVAAGVMVAVCGAGSPLAPYFSNLPEGTDPGTVSRRVTDQFLSTRPENYRPKGYHGNEGYGWNRSVQYSVVSLWVNALACARLDGDRAREAKLIRLFDDFLPGRPKNRCCSRPYHVDDTIFGALPYEIYLANKDPRYLEMGSFYADTQWTPPCEGTIKERHAPPKEVQEAYWAKGYTPQTRLWIDDMYMITVLQSQAFRATGRRAYIDRAAREMCLYLDELQLKDGPAKGLFYHAPDVKYVWGRGDGWMAAGMALVLDRLPEDSEYRPRILEGYRAMMATLLKYQRPDGLWSQLVDRPADPRNWGETSCTAMFTYAFATGVARGWLDPAQYGPAARRAWLALCARLDAFANISDVCVGTGKKDDLQYYFDRPRVNGDPHGQAPMLWIASVLLETGAGRLEGLRTPATSKHFEKRIDPVSGVVSYALSLGVERNVQSLYFTAKSMTADGRFLLVDVSRNERLNDFDAQGRPLKKAPANRKHKALVDFLKDELVELPEVDGQIPFVDVKDDYMVYFRNQAFYRRDFRAPAAETKLCDYPADLAAGRQECFCPDRQARHNMLSADKKYVVYDVAPAKWWRGCTWNVKFYNRATQRTVEVYATRPALMPESHESRLHPDPHPHFSGDGRWVISTANNARGNMEVYLTAVDQLVARTTMSPPAGGKTVVVENPLDVARPAETVSVKWADLGLRPGDTAVRVWDVAACVPVAFQDDAKRGALLFSTALAAKETRTFRILADASLPQADLSIVCWSQYLPERMDDFAWENDRFGARAYGPVIMQPAPAGQKLVSSGIDIINKCVPYPVLHRWFVERTGEGSYHRDHGEGMDNYKVGPSRGCGGLGARGADGWAFSVNWSKAKMIQCGPVRTEFELTYPAWGGFGEETRRVTLDRGQFFAHYRPRFRGQAPAGVQVGPGLDCGAARQHDGQIARDLAAGWIANWEPDGVDGADTGSIATAVLLDPADAPAATATDALGCEYLFPSAGRTSLGYWAGATWSGAGAVKDAKAWHALVRDFAAALRNPIKVSIR